MDVLGIADQIDHGQVDLDEVAEIGEGEEVGEHGRIGGHVGPAFVSGGELRHGLRGRGADLVHVEFGLGQPGDEVGQISHLASLSDPRR